MHKFAIVLMLILPLTAAAKLEVAEIQASHGPLGPVRETVDVYHLDELVIRFQILGAKLNMMKKCDVEITMGLTNPNGRKVVEEKTSVEQEAHYGNNAIPAWVKLNVPAPVKAPTGEYTLSVSIRDRQSKEATSFERKFTIREPKFQLILPRFYRDADGKIPASLFASPGEYLHYSCRIVGYDKSQKKMRVKLTAELLDEKGKEVLATFQVLRAEETDATKVTNSSQLNFNGKVFLNAPGNYRLRIRAEDGYSNATHSFEAPLKVVAP